MRTFLGLHSRIGSWAYPQILDQAGKAHQGQTLQLVEEKTFYDIETWGQYYKIFFFVTDAWAKRARVFVPGKLSSLV